MVHDAEVYRTGMTISRGTSDEGRGASRLSLSRQARTRVAGPFAGPYSFSDFPIRLRTPTYMTYMTITSEVLVSGVKKGLEKVTP